MKFNRIFLVVLDSLGVGEAIDAVDYKDNGANTLMHVNEKEELFTPNLKRLGFLDTINMNDNSDVDAYYTIARPTNKGKDSLSGHYEMMGIKNDSNLKSFVEEGIPVELKEKIEKSIGRRVIICNKVASDVDIINEFGQMQIQNAALLIYSNGNSVLKIASHEQILPVDMLYRYCDAIRTITNSYNEYKVARIVAMPFVGNKNGNFRITNNKKEFVMTPPMKSILDHLKENEYSVISIGKVYDLFNGSGITKKIMAQNNKEAVDKLLEIMDKKFKGICVTNLSDFDTYGHLGDVSSYKEAIEAFDVEIPMILNTLNNDDLLIITADHGNDPTIGNNHTRENVPVIIYSRIFKNPGKLEILNTLADIGATIAQNFDVNKLAIGNSFLDNLK